MRMCLTADQGGYCTSERQDGKDQFGRKGDFITSPEISQVFGELVGIWFVSEWIGQGRKKGIDLIEVGPGRGTLMDDMLRTIRNFKSMAESIEAIYLVETSPALRELQRKLLCGENSMEKTTDGYRSMSKYANIPVIWVENIRFVPQRSDNAPFIVAHEFFDALPVHAFQTVEVAPEEKTINTPTGIHRVKSDNAERSTPNYQWRELVVTPNQSLAASDASPVKTQPEFELSLAKSATPHSMFLPELSPRYKALKSTSNALIEISPESHSYVQDFARRIGGSKESRRAPAGAALIVDYGPSETIPTNSLRGIHQHRRVSPLSAPGTVDISADVDFIALAHAALEASLGVEVHGPVEQGFFLQAMGIKERAKALMTRLSHDAKKDDVDSAWKRLIDRGGSGMGKVYKALAIVPGTGGKRRPVGFGGNVGD